MVNRIIIPGPLARHPGEKVRMCGCGGRHACFFWGMIIGLKTAMVLDFILAVMVEYNKKS